MVILDSLASCAVQIGPHIRVIPQFHSDYQGLDVPDPAQSARRLPAQDVPVDCDPACRHVAVNRSVGKVVDVLGPMAG